MRHLVYRVQALPQSLLPLVWDFGTLRSGSTNSVEGAYVREMIRKFVSVISVAFKICLSTESLVCKALSVSVKFLFSNRHQPGAHSNIANVANIVNIANTACKAQIKIFTIT